MAVAALACSKKIEKKEAGMIEKENENAGRSAAHQRLQALVLLQIAALIIIAGGRRRPEANERRTLVGNRQAR